MTALQPLTGPERVPDADPSERLVHLSAAGVSLVLDCRGPALPAVLHWGAALGPLDGEGLRALAAAALPPSVPSAPDVPALVSLVPAAASGWMGLPGLRGSRADGSDWSPDLAVEEVEVGREDGRGGLVVVRAADPAAGLALELRVELTPSGLVRARAAVRNTAPQAPYRLDGLVLALPVPAEAAQLLDLTGRWGRERSPQRTAFTIGSRVRDNRRGRTGADATLVLAACEPGAGFRAGEVWGVHVGWSGNHRTYAERLPSGEAVLGGGELLLPGEVRLQPGEAYETPWLYGSCGHGLDEVSARFHDWMRARPGHPRSPRPVIANTWEAVYFDHDLGRLTALADAAAQVGAERFVLDDGWFRHRRDDRAGLGDWYVDEDVWPQGLHPLVQHVRGLGMQFGLWIEPEMVNPDSDLARAHPEWVMAPGERQPLLVRHQQVLDLGHPGAYEHVLERISALVAEHRIDYLKWDHNRDLTEAGHWPTGAPGVHAQTLAVYRLVDELRARHPHLEIESCSSGGARVDLGILQRTDRVWASDCIDALERQGIQRWTGLLLPPELVGSHVGAGRSHTTSRVHDLSFRAGTALFGHFGIEWDLLAATEEERAELARWVALYKELRGLLHSGRVVRGDHPDPALLVHGVVAADAARAVFALVATATSEVSPPGRVRLPGLDPQRRYRVRPLPPGDSPPGVHGAPVRWLDGDGVVLPGAALSLAGLQAPALHPDHLFLLDATAE
ncbi:alpha-galactosidase [Quadrisphaera sp. DSM 44207]|uniref:alpha-galactosidase n=1 Tax=Quadrisphaera sp. DSM 44207 TaxID=1881057 RepID=UPI00088931FC|nr:alpha-galactosidase [Quadrisphaera sp. DSM 44207]SDQ05142.1 alpha-galactosidase [Quadrisphaera sp. DSM 44207]